MDAAAWTVIGVAVGAVAGSATSLLSPLVLWKTEKKRLAVEHDNVKDRLELEQKHELDRIKKSAAIENDNYRRELVKSWRSGLGEASREYNEYENREESGDRTGTVPNFSGSAWFESLRHRMFSTVDTDVTRLITGSYLYADDTTVVALSEQIANIEKDWGLV